jgi:hypothetical protein
MQTTQIILINKIVSEDLSRGEVLYYQKGNLITSVWKGKRLVYVMSTNASRTNTTCTRKEKNGSPSSVAGFDDGNDTGFDDGNDDPTDNSNSED